MLPRASLPEPISSKRDGFGAGDEGNTEDVVIEGGVMQGVDEDKVDLMEREGTAGHRLFKRFAGTPIHMSVVILKSKIFFPT